MAILIPNLSLFSPSNLQDEAKTNLRSIFTTQVAYFGDYYTYAGGGTCFQDLGWSPAGDTIYTYYCGGGVIPPTKRGVAPCPGVKDLAATSGFAFTVMAAGNIDRDPTCDVWIMNDAKVLTHVVNDIGA